MVLDPEFRFVAAYVLILKLGMSAWMRRDPNESLGQTAESETGGGPGTTPRAWLAQGLYLAPLVVLLTEPAWLSFGQLRVPPVIPWLATMAGASAILLLIWARRSTILGDSTDGTEARRKLGPFRFVRYPDAVADGLFYMSLSVVVSNWAVLIAAISALILYRLRSVPQGDALRRQRLGPVYDAYVQATGAILPRISPPAQRQYKVPVRFGMAAIVALLTTFGVVFGVLKYIEAPPEVYLFVASEIAAVCLVQIMFGSMPRGASILTGAVLLPFWMTIYLRSPPNWMTPGMVAMCYLFCFVFGGLLGYCLGALAAGFFLVMDLVDSALAVGGQTEHVASAPAENAHLSRPDQALLASDLATQSLIGAGDSASATTQPGDWVREYLQNNRR